MPNLVGIGNSQVPTNAMLGGLAYQDSVGEVVIDKIKAKTSDTAVDVFVYDTRKDSDGGAWRKKATTQSWYNEGVSSKRGARKEFPAVAVIVCLSNHIKIYDGDDSNLPLWMDVRATTARRDHGWMYGSTLNAVTALNGVIAIAANWNIGDEGGVLVMDFVKDELRRQEGGSSRSGGGLIISQRGTSANLDVTQDIALIVDSYVRDVAMTVLPNAPIDTSTGLPTPTIVVGTNGGISVITDSGVVYDLTTNQEADDIAEIAFLADNRYSFATTANNSRWWVDDIQTADENHNYFYQRTTYDYSQGSQGSINPLGRNNGTGRGELGEAIFRQASGMSRIRYVDTLINYTTTDFNTGWMVGDIKGAFLSSTDDTNLGGGNKVSNGSNWSGAQSSQSSTAPTGWTGGNGATWKTETGNGAVGTYIRLYNENNGGAGPNSYMYQAITTVAGKKYKFSAYQIHHATITVNMQIGTTAGGNQLGGSQFVSSSSNTPRHVTGTFTATGTTTYVSLGIISGTHNYGVGWDEVIVTETDEDRTSTDNGLHVYGTITKEPVATGAELVSYGGYTYNNYLDMYEQTAPGTGDFSVTAWIKPGTNGSGTGNYFHLFNMGRYNVTGQNSGTGFVLKMATHGSGGYSPYIYNNDGGTSHGTYNTNNRIPLGVWSQLIGMRRDGRAYLYLNGELLITGNTWTTNLTDTYISIGRAPGFANEIGGDAKLALVRYSLDAPSAEAIKKSYNDEKQLFVENAKCTLYGTSNEVTALAYDDSNNVLHAGTSSGRSEFRGLNRINNTTTAVTNAISASDGLVAEE